MYLVKLILSSEEIVENSKYLDEWTKELKLKYDKETRQKIGYVREKYRNLAYQDAVRFYGLHLVSDDKLGHAPRTKVRGMKPLRDQEA